MGVARTQSLQYQCTIWYMKHTIFALSMLMGLLYCAPGDPNAAQANGGDIRFSTDSAGASQIALEVVVWTQNANPASAAAELWVGPVAVNSASDVTIYVWYSAGGAVSQPAAGAAFGSQTGI